MKKRIAALVGAGLLMCSTVPAFASGSVTSKDVSKNTAAATTTTTTTSTTVTDQKSPATGVATTLPVAAAICAAGMAVCGLKVKFD